MDEWNGRGLVVNQYSELNSFLKVQCFFFLSLLFIRRLTEETAPLPVPPVRQVALPNKHADTATVTHNFDNYGRNLIRLKFWRNSMFKAVLLKMPRAARRSAAGNVFFSIFFFMCCSVFLGKCLYSVRRSRTLLKRNHSRGESSVASCPQRHQRVFARVIFARALPDMLRSSHRSFIDIFFVH